MIGAIREMEGGDGLTNKDVFLKNLEELEKVFS
jgi:hypothetical protein